MKKLACVLGTAAILALGTPALAYGAMNEEMHGQLVALGIDDESIGMFDEGHAEEIEAILASEDEDDVRRDRILSLVVDAEATND